MPAYTKTTWVNGTTPAINATNLNKIEQGIADAVRKDGSEAMSAQLVTIAGSAATPAIAPTGDSNTGIFFPAADTIAFGEGGAEAMRINSSGNVGIGTTSPGTKLDVRGAGEIARFCGTNTSNTYITFGDGTTQFGDIGYDARDTNAFSIFNGQSGPLIFGAVSERMRITSAGNVGIGTTSPDVFSRGYSGTILGISSSGQSAIELNSGTGYTCYFDLGVAGTRVGSLTATSTDTTLGTIGAFPLNFSTNGSVKAVITDAGYLLVGYASSNGAYPLQVNGQIFATSSTIATSDGRYKKDIVSLDGALDIVAALNPVQFSWKDHPVHKFNTDVPTIGFIAQEVAEVLKDKAYLTSVIKKSECTWETETGEVIEREVTRDVEKQVEREVIEEVDGEEIARTITETVIEQVTEIVNEPVKEVHTEEFYGIAESNMIAILTKAIQELKAEVDALKAQLAGN
jgi:hypothetical protein